MIKKIKGKYVVMSEKTGRKFGTYDISIVPGPDCCTMFMPRQPATKSNPALLDEIEKGLDVEKLVRMGLEKMEITEV